MSLRRVRPPRPLLRWPILLAAALLLVLHAPSARAQSADRLDRRVPSRVTLVSPESDALAGTLGSQGYAIVPLNREAGPHLEVVARINGVPGRFLVDTGAQITVVNSTSLGRFHLAAVKTGVRVYGAVGGPGETIQAALASRLQIGPCSASPFLLGVSDLSALNQGRPGHHPVQFDGIIGADVLQNFSVIIDFNGLRLYARPDSADVHPGNSPEGNNLGGFLRGCGYGQIEMKRMSISDFEVLANVNGHRALWLVDTGAAITLLDTVISRRAGIKLNRTNFTVGGAGGGRRRIDIGIVDNLKLSSVQVGSAVIAASDISVNTGLNEPGKLPIDGYLGADFLREKHAVIDCAQMRLYLRGKGK